MDIAENAGRYRPIKRAASFVGAAVYDPLDRLDYSTRNGSTNLDMTYTAIGNITKKSDVSANDYIYTGTQTGCSYYAHSQPHAVRRVDSAVYCYDASGNMTKRNGGKDRGKGILRAVSCQRAQGGRGGDSICAYSEPACDNTEVVIALGS